MVNKTVYCNSVTNQLSLHCALCVWGEEICRRTDLMSTAIYIAVNSCQTAV